MKIGLTMRQSCAQDYQEERDAIARDWPRFLQQHLPGMQWMLLPNLSAADMVAYASQWELDGFLFTGGDDPGTDSLRDEAEKALLDYAVAKGKPVLGVCRGFQVIQRYLGGALAPISAGRHVSCIHAVQFASRPGLLFAGEMEARVNSYHSWGITAKALAPPLQPLAMMDEWVECAISYGPDLMGMFWHPERAGGNPSLDGDLMVRFFRGKLRMAMS